MANKHVKRGKHYIFSGKCKLKLQWLTIAHLLAKSQNTENTKCWCGCGETGSFIHCWWECRIVWPLWKTFWLFLTKLNIVLLYDPVIAFLGIYPNQLRIYAFKKTGIAILIATLFITGKTWKQQICLSVSEWINKLWKIHALEYYSAIERNELSNHERTWGKFKYILLSKEPIWKGYSMLPGIQHSGKGKTKKIIKRWVFTRGWGEKGMNKHSIGSF